MKIYVIGSLKSRHQVMKFANELREQGHVVFDDWTSPGPAADLYLHKYYKQRGFTYDEMVQSPAARNNYLFDRKNLEDSDVVIMYGKCGKSGHLELGWCARTKPAFLFMEKPPQRPDIMYGFLFDSGGGVFFDRAKLFEKLKKIVSGEKMLNWSSLTKDQVKSMSVSTFRKCSVQPGFLDAVSKLFGAG